MAWLRYHGQISRRIGSLAVYVRVAKTASHGRVENRSVFAHGMIFVFKFAFALQYFRFGDAFELHH